MPFQSDTAGKAFALGPGSLVKAHSALQSRVRTLAIIPSPPPAVHAIPFPADVPTYPGAVRELAARESHMLGPASTQSSSSIASMKDGILYQNGARTVILIDIPRSIEQDQETLARLASPQPPETPYPSTEPKGPKRQQLTDAIPASELRYRADTQNLLSLALEGVREFYDKDEWCLPRVIRPEGGDWAGSAATAPNSPLAVLSPLTSSYRAARDLNSVVCNPSPTQVVLFIGPDRFHIPPGSTFLWSTLKDGIAAFSQSLKLLLPKEPNRNNNRYSFDFILLDPPWSNRSVRRGRVYSTAEDQEESPFDQTLPIIRDHLSELGVVAVWITNKAAVRSQVLQSLATLGLRAFEEWIWAKVTTRGEPVTALDGIWRRPYEVLLLFRKEQLLQPFDPSDGSGGERQQPLSRRVIIAVPDTHSRKPSIKKLIKPFLPEPYIGLELFARSLTSGWWSWGDEVLKFQHERCWVD